MTTIRETFSKRRRRETEPAADVYTYDSFPSELRNKIIHIWRASIGPYWHNGNRWAGTELWDQIEVTLAREFGLLRLFDHPIFGKVRGIHYNPDFICDTYFQLVTEPDRVLDTIETVFQFIERSRKYAYPSVEKSQASAVAISDLNTRLREHGVGYRYESGQLMRLDSTYLHAEATVPALSLLSAPAFRGADEEFRNAHKHYRAAAFKEAVAEALKAMESTLKTICLERKWKPPENATAIPLLNFVFENGLIPRELQSEFEGLRVLLSSGLPTLKNRKAGHGQGSVPVEMPAHIAAYALHMAAANIVFLVESHKSLPLGEASKQRHPSSSVPTGAGDADGRKE